MLSVSLGYNYDNATEWNKIKFDTTLVGIIYLLFIPKLQYSSFVRVKNTRIRESNRGHSLYLLSLLSP